MQEYVDSTYVEANTELKEALIKVYSICAKMANESQEND